MKIGQLGSYFGTAAVNFTLVLIVSIPISQQVSSSAVYVYLRHFSIKMVVSVLMYLSQLNKI